MLTTRVAACRVCAGHGRVTSTGRNSRAYPHPAHVHLFALRSHGVRARASARPARLPPPRTHTRHAGERKTLFFPQMIDLDSSCPATPARVLAQGLSDHRSPRTHARHHPAMLAHCHALANQSDVCRMRRRAPAHPQLPYTSCQARPGLLAPRRRASHHAHNLCRCALPAGA